MPAAVPILAVARAVAPGAASNASNTAANQTVTLYFQQWPGVDPASGVAALSLKVTDAGGSRDEKTPNDGHVAVELPPPGSTAAPALVQIVDPTDPSKFAAEFEVTLRTALPELDPAKPQGSKDYPGLRTRLNMLGYNAGLEAGAAMGAELERAVLNFEADHPTLRLEGVLDRLADEYMDGATAPSELVQPDTVRELVREIQAAGGDSAAPAIAPAISGVGAGSTANSGPRMQRAILDWERVVLVRIDRADPPSGEFDPAYPFVDDRGFIAEKRLNDVHGPAVSMVGGSSIRLKLVRENLKPDAPLHLVSSDTLLSLTNADVPAGASAEIELKAGSLSKGQEFTVVTVEVRLGAAPSGKAASGPLLHSFAVVIFEEAVAQVAVWAMEVEDAAGFHKPETTQEKAEEMLASLNRYWQPAGIRLSLKSYEDVNAREVKVSKKGYSTNVKALGAFRHDPNAINVYIIKHLQIIGADSHLKGEAWTPPDTVAQVNPPDPSAHSIGMGALFVRQEAVNNEEVQFVAAHELGHFLGLGHVSEDPYQVSCWHTRRLMFAYTKTRQAGFQPKLAPRGVGTALTIKDLANIDEDHGTGAAGWYNDAEAFRAREEVLWGRCYDCIAFDPGKCFIATAAYGSAMEPQVLALRKFRDERLMASALGRAFVKTYYFCSPPLARFIAQRDWLRALARTALQPLVNAVAMHAWA